MAGGERIPIKLRDSMNVKERIREFFRDVVNFFVKYDPLMIMTFASAERIYTTSEQTKNLLPKRFRKKAKIQLAIGVECTQKKICKRSTTSIKNYLYVGNFVYLKGMIFGLQAFSKALTIAPDITLTLVGRGEGKIALKLLVQKLGIEDNVLWVDWVSQSELNKLYEKNDALLFPSLRDSGGMVVLEAMSFGLPVICLNLGGPGIMVNESCGIKITVNQLSEKLVIEELSNAILTFSSNLEYRHSLVKGALLKAKEMNWKDAVSNVYKVTDKL